ncbi:unnamed protein product [Brachionus calyciflorus]|uniref:Uncharacterized protein n=1 Tax=Brachionus calyciflorus TaxID=104777 RepID=A0A813PXG4_9BILA|nr:unnamed protein product [Brachionus calyciflorus]
MFAQQIAAAPALTAGQSQLPTSSQLERQLQLPTVSSVQRSIDSQFLAQQNTGTAAPALSTRKASTVIQAQSAAPAPTTAPTQTATPTRTVAPAPTAAPTKTATPTRTVTPAQTFVQNQLPTSSQLERQLQLPTVSSVQRSIDSQFLAQQSAVTAAPAVPALTSKKTSTSVPVPYVAPAKTAVASAQTHLPTSSQLERQLQFPTISTIQRSIDSQLSASQATSDAAPRVSSDQKDAATVPPPDCPCHLKKLLGQNAEDAPSQAPITNVSFGAQFDASAFQFSFATQDFQSFQSADSFSSLGLSQQYGFGGFF